MAGRRNLLTANSLPICSQHQEEAFSEAARHCNHSQEQEQAASSVKEEEPEEGSSEEEEANPKQEEAYSEVRRAGWAAKQLEAFSEAEVQPEAPGEDYSAQEVQAEDYLEEVAKHKQTQAEAYLEAAGLPEGHSLDKVPGERLLGAEYSADLPPAAWAAAAVSLLEVVQLEVYSEVPLHNQLPEACLEEEPHKEAADCLHQLRQRWPPALCLEDQVQYSEELRALVAA